MSLTELLVLIFCFTSDTATKTFPEEEEKKGELTQTMKIMSINSWNVVQKIRKV